MSSLIDGRADAENAKKRKSARNKMKKHKSMNYAEIKKWNQSYRLDGKSVYQLDAEFTSLVKIQVQELQK